MFRTLMLATLVSLPAVLPASALDVATAVLRVDRPSLLPISRLDLPPGDLGFAGATLGNEDNLTTGQFLGTTYSIETRALAPEEIQATVEELRGQGIGLFVVLGTGADVLEVTDAAGSDALVFNAGRWGQRAARRGMPGDAAAHRAEPVDADRCGGAVPDVEAVAGLGADPRIEPG